ncbi:hypothetical protein HanPSC8_Chr10g0413351 [Helianthus annuus]|nr:hypothetical protein HanPSC8_Chr10g0413351 [Helianthus annuus]
MGVVCFPVKKQTYNKIVKQPYWSCWNLQRNLVRRFDPPLVCAMFFKVSRPSDFISKP